MARRRTGREEPEGSEPGPPADPVAVAREIVLRQLSSRARTRAELAEALDKRAVPGAAADEVLARFTELGLIDDAQFAEAWVEGQRRRMRSTRVLARELRVKGVERDVIEEAIDALPDDADYEAALAFGWRRASTMTKLDPAVRYRRLAGALARRGFSSEIVRRVVGQVTARASEVDEC